MVNQDSDTIAKRFVEHVVLRFGIPEIIFSELGKAFVSELMTKTLKLLGIKQYNTSPYRPQSNGALERQHKVLKAMLRAYSNAQKNDWP